MSEQKRGRPKHEHFCWQCYGKPESRRGSAYSTNGWWKCNDYPCVKGNRDVCPKHLKVTR